MRGFVAVVMCAVLLREATKQFELSFKRLRTTTFWSRVTRLNRSSV